MAEVKELGISVEASTSVEPATSKHRSRQPFHSNSPCPSLTQELVRVLGFRVMGVSARALAGSSPAAAASRRLDSSLTLALSLSLSLSLSRTGLGIGFFGFGVSSE